jgi:hypothetical protein
MSALYTPGPWEKVEDKAIVRGNRRFIADCQREPRGTKKAQEEDGANAHLIHGAPDLLAASSELLDILRDMPRGPQHEAMIKLCHAITKAKGEEMPQ